MKSTLFLLGSTLLILSFPISAFKPLAENPASAQVPVGVNDLVISALKATVTAPNKIRYDYTVTNLGTRPAKLEGPTPASGDNVAVQALLSADTAPGGGDIGAGGRALGNSPIGSLGAGASISGFLIVDVPNLNLDATPFLILQVDSGEVLTEGSETNNIAVVGVGK